jgi:hypothetical protein
LEEGVADVAGEQSLWLMRDISLSERQFSRQHNLSFLNLYNAAAWVQKRDSDAVLSLEFCLLLKFVAQQQQWTGVCDGGPSSLVRSRHLLLFHSSRCDQSLYSHIFRHRSFIEFTPPVLVWIGIHTSRSIPTKSAC